MGSIVKLLKRKKPVFDVGDKPKDTTPDKNGYWLKFYKTPDEFKEMYKHGASCMHRLSCVVFYAYVPNLYGVALYNGDKFLARRFVFGKTSYIGPQYAAPNLGGLSYKEINKVFRSQLARAGFKQQLYRLPNWNGEIEVAANRGRLPYPYFDFLDASFSVRYDKAKKVYYCTYEGKPGY